VIFPGLVAADSASADIMINVTNDAWFGNTPGPYQHFRQAQLRAVETGRPLLRAANTGISGVVGQRGIVVDGLAIGTQGIIDSRIPIYLAETITERQRRINGIILVMLLVIGAFVVNVRQSLRTN
jgi:apolipoprotein N-acyltransferase